jgi:hypothetical protein
MTRILVALAVLLLAGPAFAIEPIPGSITYGGGPHAPLQKSPVGSVVKHTFSNGGYDYQERYVVQPDRSLRLVSRSRQSGR